MTTHEVLVKARNLIERDGWFALHPTGETHREGTDPQCVITAIGCFTHRYEPVLAAVADAIGCSGCEVDRWNDEPGRTKKEVLGAFDKAIAATAPEPDTSFLKAEEPVPA